MNYQQYGFTYTGSCSCDGIQTEKYKNGQWLLKFRPKHGVYRFKRNGRTVSEWINEEKAEEFIKEKICLDAVKN